MIVVSSTVILVTARLGYDIHRAAARAAKLRGKAVCLHAELLHGVRRRAEGDAVEVAKGVHRAVQQDLVGGCTSSAHREIRIEDASPATRVAHLALGHHTRRQAHHRHHVALHQRQLINGLRANSRAEVARFGL